MPIEIIPEVPIYIASDESGLGKGGAVTDPQRLTDTKYVLPEGKPAKYTVRVTGFPDASGGMIQTSRVTSGDNTDIFTLITAADHQLYSNMGGYCIGIDGVLYVAKDPEPPNGKS